MNAPAMNKPCKETMDVFGRILYAIAKVDGKVQKSEINVLHEVVLQDPWAKQIELSFDMSHHFEMDPRIIFWKNMRVFRTKAAKEHYPYFLNLLTKVAEAHVGIITEEQKMIDEFRSYFEKPKSSSKQAITKNYLSPALS